MPGDPTAAYTSVVKVFSHQEGFLCLGLLHTGTEVKPAFHILLLAPHNEAASPTTVDPTTAN